MQIVELESIKMQLSNQIESLEGKLTKRQDQDRAKQLRTLTSELHSSQESLNKSQKRIANLEKLKDKDTHDLITKLEETISG